MKAVFGLTVVISLILAIAAAAIIYLTSYTFSSHPTLLVFKQNPAGSTSPISLYAYKSQTTKIKKEDDKDKFASANIAFATDINVPRDTTVTPVQEEELAFATKPEDPFKSDELPDFKIKTILLLINPVLSKEEKKDVPFDEQFIKSQKIVIHQALLQVANDKYPLQMLAEKIFNKMKSTGKAEVPKNDLSKYQKEYDNDTAHKYVRFYSYRCDYTLKESEEAREIFVECAKLDDAANRAGGSLAPIDKDFKRTLPMNLEERDFAIHKAKEFLS